MSVIGLICGANNADFATFPVDTPVSFASNDTAYTGKLGVNNTAVDSINLINAQLGEFQSAARIVFVRIPETPANPAQTFSRIAGNSTIKTGMWAFTKAGPELGIIPRIIIAPGYTSFQNSGVATATVTVQGNNYATAPTITATGGTGSGAAATAAFSAGAVTTITITAGGTAYGIPPNVVLTGGGGTGAAAEAIITNGVVTSIFVTAGGTGYTSAPAVSFTHGGGTAVLTAVVTGLNVTAITVTNGGSGYTSAPTLSFSGGGGTLAAGTCTIDQLANPVCAALPGLLDQLMAVAIVDGPNSTLTAFKNWEQTIESKRMIGCETAVKVGVNGVLKPASPALAGLMVKADFETGGIPMRSIGNRAIQGIVGAGRPIAFSWTDGAVEGQQIIAFDGGIIVRAEAGVETAVSSNGFIFLGTNSMTADTNWQFYNQVRVRDYAHLALLKTLRFFIQRYNLTGHTLQSVYNTMYDFCSSLKAREAIIDFRISIPTDINTAGELAIGHITFDLKMEEPPPLNLITIRSQKYRSVYDGLIANLQAQLDAAL
jgi:phage tail sheath protein FI